MRPLLFTLITLFSTCQLWAQTDSVERANQYLTQGMDAYNFSHNKEAIVLFKKAVKADPKNARAHLMAGKSILLTIGKRAALDHFKSAYKLNPEIDEDIL